MDGNWTYEPMTFATDFILGAVSLYCGIRISQLYWEKFCAFHFHLGWTFYMLSLAAFLDAIFHGFGPHFPESLRDFIWKAVLMSAGLAGIFLLLGSLSVVVAGNTYNLLRWIPVLGFFVFAFIVLGSGDILWVARFCGPVILFVLGMMIHLSVATGDGGARTFVLGIAISLVGAVAWQAQLSPHPHFSHNDLYHLIQTVGIWVMYRGGLAIRTGAFTVVETPGAS